MAKKVEWKVTSSFTLFEEHNKKFLYKESFSIEDLSSWNCSWNCFWNCFYGQKCAQSQRYGQSSTQRSGKKPAAKKRPIIKERPNAKLDWAKKKHELKEKIT